MNYGVVNGDVVVSVARKSSCAGTTAPHPGARKVSIGCWRHFASLLKYQKAWAKAAGSKAKSFNSWTTELSNGMIVGSSSESVSLVVVVVVAVLEFGWGVGFCPFAACINAVLPPMAEGAYGD